MIVHKYVARCDNCSVQSSAGYTKENFDGFTYSLRVSGWNYYGATGRVLCPTCVARRLGSAAPAARTYKPRRAHTRAR